MLRTWKLLKKRAHRQIQVQKRFLKQAPYSRSHPIIAHSNVNKQLMHRKKHEFSIFFNFSIFRANFEEINYILLSSLGTNMLQLWCKFHAIPFGSFAETVYKNLFFKIEFLSILFTFFNQIEKCYPLQINI